MTTASVCIFSYNNAGYIAEALESVLAQETHYDFEIIVGDDASTDNSCEVVQSIQRNPAKIRLLKSERNLGGTQNWLRTLKAANGEFIFTLDADDYFVAYDQIQSQIDALRSDASLSMAFHAVIEDRTLLGEKSQINEFEVRRHTLEDFFRSGWYMRTSSLCFRASCLHFPFPDWVNEYPYKLDLVLHVMMLMQGESYYDNRPMTTWRRHPQGMSIRLEENDFLSSYFQHKALAWQLHRYSNARFSSILTQRLKREASIALLRALSRDLQVVQRRHFFQVFLESDWMLLVRRLLDNTVES